MADSDGVYLSKLDWHSSSNGNFCAGRLEVVDLEFPRYVTEDCHQ